MAKKTKRMRKASFKIDGMEEFQKKLNDLPKNLQRNAAREATRRGAEIIMKDAKRNLHHAKASYKVKLANGETITRQPGDLAKALSMARIPPSEAPSNLSTHKVMFLRKVENDIYKIAHFIEYGVSPHDITSKHGKTWKHGGHEDYPFFRPAVRKNKAKIKNAMGEVLEKGVIEEIMKGWKK